MFLKTAGGCLLNRTPFGRLLVSLFCVYPPQLPYTVQSRDDNDELFNFRQNDDVRDLREKHQADLVVLVGVFPAVCGRA